MVSLSQTLTDRNSQLQWASTSILRKTVFLPFPQQFEALFHSRDRGGGSRGGFVPFPQQPLFPCTSLAPSGRLPQDSCGSTWEVHGEEPECEFTSCRGWFLGSLACSRSDFSNMLKILAHFLPAFSSICPGKPACHLRCLSSFNSRLIGYTEVSRLWWIGRKLWIGRLCGVLLLPSGWDLWSSSLLEEMLLL